jgi:hypothetical protein
MKQVALAVLVLIGSVAMDAGQTLTAPRLSNSPIKYVSNQLKEYPLPAIVFRRGGLTTESDRKEIVEAIVYPAVNRSERPVAAVIVELFPDATSVSVTLVWHERPTDGTSRGVLIHRNATGHFDREAWLALFGDGI